MGESPLSPFPLPPSSDPPPSSHPRGTQEQFRLGGGGERGSCVAVPGRPAQRRLCIRKTISFLLSSPSLYKNSRRMKGEQDGDNRETRKRKKGGRGLAPESYSFSLDVRSRETVLCRPHEKNRGGSKDSAAASSSASLSWRSDLT